MPRPMPRLDPVTSATFPFNPNSIRHSPCYRSNVDVIALVGAGMKGAGG